MLKRNLERIFTTAAVVLAIILIVQGVKTFSAQAKAKKH